VSAEKLGVTGSNGVNVIHEAHGAVSGRDSFGAGLSRFELTWSRPETLPAVVYVILLVRRDFVGGIP
jgi:hypothetical protein